MMSLCGRLLPVCPRVASGAVLRADWDTEVNGAAGRAGHGVHVYVCVHGCLCVTAFI